MRHLRFLVFALALAMVTAGASAQRRGQIQEGSPAPGLDIEQWYNSDGVSIEAGKPYLVVFVEPGEVFSDVLVVILDELHEELSEQGLEIIAVSGDDDETIGGFVRRSTGQQLKFAIGRDRRSATSRAWMRASGRDEFPTCFIVGMESKIQYIGSPFVDEFDDILNRVIDNRYDHETVQNGNRYLRPAANARKIRDYRQCFMHLDKAIELDKRIFARQMLVKFEIMLIDQKDPEAAYEYARKLIDENGDDPNFLGWMVEFIVTDPRLSESDRDLDVALAAAEAAAKSFAEHEPYAYSLQALVHFHRQELEPAIELQERAWLIARPRLKPEYWRTLVSYKDAAKRRQTASNAG